MTTGGFYILGFAVVQHSTCAVLENFYSHYPAFRRVLFLPNLFFSRVTLAKRVLSCWLYNYVRVLALARRVEKGDSCTVSRHFAQLLHHLTVDTCPRTCARESVYCALPELGVTPLCFVSSPPGPSKITPLQTYSPPHSNIRLICSAGRKLEICSGLSRG